MEFVRPKSAREHGVQDVTSDFKKIVCLAPFRPMFDLLERGQRVAYIERNQMPCAPSKSVGNFLRKHGRSEAPTPQAEPLEAAKNGVNTFLVGFRILYISNLFNFHSFSCILRRNFPYSTLV